MVKPSLRREMAQEAGSRRGVSIRLACCIFVVSETCYRYQPKLSRENEKIADCLITGITASPPVHLLGFTQHPIKARL